MDAIFNGLLGTMHFMSVMRLFNEITIIEKNMLVLVDAVLVYGIKTFNIAGL